MHQMFRQIGETAQEFQVFDFLKAKRNTIKLIQSTPDKTSLKKNQSKPFNHGGARRIQQQKSVQPLHEWLAFCPHQSTPLCLCASIGDLRHAFCFGVISIFTLDAILFPLLTPHEFVFFLCLL